MFAGNCCKLINCKLDLFSLVYSILNVYEYAFVFGFLFQMNHVQVQQEKYTFRPLF